MSEKIRVAIAVKRWTAMNKQTEIEKELAQLPILEYVFFKPEEIIFS